MERVTKIIATIGPACQSIPTLTELLLAGVNVTRLNFSHGTHENHAQVLHNLRELSEKLNHPICILQDLQGPKIRVGEIEHGAVELIVGASISITTRSMLGNARLISVEFPELPDCVKPGSRILLDDGNLELQVVSIQDDLINCKIVTGGILKPKKGLNLPGVSLPVSALTEKDKEDLAFGLSIGVDMIALSFVRTVEDIQYCRQIMQELAPGKTPIPIIAKLERPEALQNLDAIVCAADGVMVARGDLGVEMSPEEVPIAQKRIIESANLHGRVVITATQMLDSMVNNSRPTRAEASDVANAIFDGTDAVMLSGETATGKFPVKVVQTMSAIICQAEKHMTKWGNWQGIHQPDYSADDAYYVAQAAKALADDSNVAAVAVFSHSGRTARVMSKIRPSVPILGFTSSQLTFNQMQLYWGVVSHLVPHANTIEDMLAFVDAALIQSTDIQPGQQVVLVCGYPLNAGRPPNLALLHTVGE